MSITLKMWCWEATLGIKKKKRHRPCPQNHLWTKGAVYVNHEGLSKTWNKRNCWLWAQYGIHSYSFPNQLHGWCRKFSVCLGTIKEATSKSPGREQEPKGRATQYVRGHGKQTKLPFYILTGSIKEGATAVLPHFACNPLPAYKMPSCDETVMCLNDKW